MIKIDQYQQQTLQIIWDIPNTKNFDSFRQKIVTKEESEKWKGHAKTSKYINR